METDKPMAGALRAVENHCDHTEPQAHWVDDMDACSECVRLAHDFARESGLEALVEAVEMARVTDPGTGSLSILIRRDDWNRIVVAARSVREG